MAVPEETASRQPRLPHWHEGSANEVSTVVCPTSAVRPLAPKSSSEPRNAHHRSAAYSGADRNVEQAPRRVAACAASRPAPKWNSPMAAIVGVVADQYDRVGRTVPATPASAKRRPGPSGWAADTGCHCRDRPVPLRQSRLPSRRECLPRAKASRSNRPGPQCQVFAPCEPPCGDSDGGPAT